MHSQPQLAAASPPAAVFSSQPTTMTWSAFDIAAVVAVALILLVVFAL